MNLSYIAGLLASAFARSVNTLLPALCLFQTGCAGSGSGIVIHDYATAKTVGVIPMGYFREIIRTESHPTGAFFTMTEENDQLVIRKRDSIGMEVSKQFVPMLNTVWHQPNWCALNDSGDRLAYYERNTKRLELRNIIGGATITLPTPLINSATAMKLFDWTGPETLLLMTTRPDKDNSMEISRINIKSREIHTNPIDFYWTTTPILSPDRKWLAGVTRDEAKIAIVDSILYARKSTIPKSTPETYIDDIQWSADSKWLYCVFSSTQDKYRRIVRHNLSTNVEEHIPSPTSNGFILRGTLGDTITASSLEGNATWLLDVKQGKWRAIGRSNGEIYGIRGTTHYAITQ